MMTMRVDGTYYRYVYCDAIVCVLLAKSSPFISVVEHAYCIANRRSSNQRGALAADDSTSSSRSTNEKRSEEFHEKHPLLGPSSGTVCRNLDR
jgi:hypothetical protein